METNPEEATSTATEGQVDGDGEGVEPEEECKEEILDEVAREGAAGGADLGQLQPGGEGDQEADDQVSDKEDGHLAHQVLSQAWHQDVGGQGEHHEDNTGALIIIRRSLCPSVPDYYSTRMKVACELSAGIIGI